MTEDDVRAAAERLVQFHERFAPLFGREQAQDHAYTYGPDATTYLSGGCHNLPIIDVCTTASPARSAERPPWGSFD